MTDENHDNPHEADLLNAMTLSTAEKKEYMATAGQSSRQMKRQLRERM